MLFVMAWFFSQHVLPIFVKVEGRLIHQCILIKYFNSLAPGRYGSNFKNAISEHMLRIKFRSIFVALLSGDCHKAALTISQHGFMQWLGAVRQQAITWAGVYLDICHQTAALPHNGLTHRSLDQCDSIISENDWHGAFLGDNIYEFKIVCTEYHLVNFYHSYCSIDL